MNFGGSEFGMLSIYLANLSFQSYLYMYKEICCDAREGYCNAILSTYLLLKNGCTKKTV